MVVPYISETLLFSKDKLQTSKKVKVFSRSSKILLHFLDKTFLVYNGHKFVHLLIRFSRKDFWQSVYALRGIPAAEADNVGHGERA